MHCILCIYIWVLNKALKTEAHSPLCKLYIYIYIYIYRERERERELSKITSVPEIIVKKISHHRQLIGLDSL